ncbi:alpha/beta hydrolase [Cryptosporangium arvum]|uniref:alpha/beta hydrolase n=1 Tax=Cryptosporangium arvum TaxID=80871 RepID=UPI001B8053B9|nr:alpha/beta hydrolase family protein [Cryptosporangium arvum]
MPTYIEEPIMQYVFVPGAWHGGWAWHPVARRVRAAGHGVTALTMPGLSLGEDSGRLRLADAVDFLVDEVERRDLVDVVLVGHSWGGIPVVAAAERLRKRLARLDFFSAFIPRAGESMADAMGPEVGAFLRTSIESAADRTISVDFESFQASLMPGEPEALQRLVFEQLVPQPGGYMLDALESVDVPGLGVPVGYVLAADDRALAAPGAELAARAGVEPVLVPGGHEALLTAPDLVADALLGR